MLVSVLVLGVMGCGKKNLETGNEIPFALHGTWILTTNPAPTAATVIAAPHFTVTANEVTVRIPNVDVAGGTVQYAFRAEYGGDKVNPEASAGGLSLKLTRIVDGVEWGTYRFTYAQNDPSVASSVSPIHNGDKLTAGEPPKWQASLVPYYEFYAMFQEGNVFTRANALTP